MGTLEAGLGGPGMTSVFGRWGGFGLGGRFQVLSVNLGKREVVLRFVVCYTNHKILANKE
jgi:hypothetical protein